MKIIYILKKGLQCYPPCLTQVLTLNDLKINLIVYHGRNSNYVNELLDERRIEHHTFVSDRDSSNTFESIINFLRFKKEAVRTQKDFPKETLLWIGNMETAMSLQVELLCKTPFVLNVLELYNEKTIYDRWLKKNINKAKVVVACEKHRAAIMQCRFSMDKKPIVIPNKPYELETKIASTSMNGEIEKRIKGAFVLVYQGMISKDRPLENIARALFDINEEVVFLVMGACNDSYKESIKKIYSNTIFTGYIPAPEHLAYTELCDVGIANYEKSSLNNVFCAPNKIYEYTKYGIPIIASNNIALEETVGATGAGECTDFNNIREIARCILKIKNEYDIYSDNALKFYNSICVEKKISSVIMKAEKG